MVSNVSKWELLKEILSFKCQIMGVRNRYWIVAKITLSKALCKMRLQNPLVQQNTFFFQIEINDSLYIFYFSRASRHTRSYCFEKRTKAGHQGYDLSWHWVFLIWSLVVSYLSVSYPKRLYLPTNPQGVSAQKTNIDIGDTNTTEDSRVWVQLLNATFFF
jgi:hypothetical protein